MTQTGSVASGELYNAQVTLAAGKVWTSDIKNHKKGGFRIAGNFNKVALDNLAATLTLESWDYVLAEWIPEPLAIFEVHPAGIAVSTVDTFTETQAELYRVGIEPTAGVTGWVQMSFAEQTEE